MNSRNQILDLFKGVAIISVILYHAGLFKYGYLGVEMFLVIGGYLITKSILRTYDKGSFTFFEYLSNRLVRLWPLALTITVISLLCGYFLMLPDAFKNTCETAIGTSTFTNNFVQYITAGNYWDTANDFKPLMHTWYLGVIFQFYVIYPLAFMICHRFWGNYIKASRVVLSVVFALSLALFVVPYFDTAFTFYLLPARLFEFAVGGILALSNINSNSKNDVVNTDERIEFYGQYINMMDSIRNTDGSISLFTKDKKLISHDGIHLTRAGAKKYAELINVNELLISNR